MRRLNVRLLVILVVGVAVGGAVIQGLHAFQVHRYTGAFLREADRAEQSRNPQEAVEFLRRYLLLATQDTQTMARLGKLLFDQRRFYESQTILSQVVQRDQDNDDARRRLVDVSIRLGRYQDAQYQLDGFLLKSHPDEGDLFLQLGTCQQALGEYVPAASSFALASEKNPALIAAYERLAQILVDHPQILAGTSFPRILKELLSKYSSSLSTLPKLKTLLELLNDRKQPSAALTVLNLMVSRNPKSHEAHLVRGRFVQLHVGDPLVRAALLGSGGGPDSEQLQEMFRKAFDDAKQAVDLAPTNSQALLFAARAALANGSAKEAKEFAQRASKQDPSNADVYLVLASLDLREKRPKEAADLLSRGVKATGGDPVLLWTLADLRIGTNDIQEASKLVDRLRASESARPIVQYLSARMLIVESKWAEASRQLEAVGGDLKRWPQIYQESQYWRAQCYSRLGRDDLAVGAYRAALEIDPVWTPARSGLAEALRAQGRIDEAVVEGRRLLQLPNAPLQTSMTLLRLAVLQNLSLPSNERDWVAIENELDAAIKHQPTADAIVLAAEVRVAKGKIEDARQMLSSAVAAHPKEPALWNALIALASRREAWNESERLLRDMQGRFGDVVSFRLSKAEYLVRRFGTSRKTDLRALADPPPAYSASDRLSLVLGMAQRAVAIQDFEQAERLWQRAADGDPTNLQYPLLLFDLALQMERPDAMKRALEKVQAIEQKGPISLYGEAMRLAILAKQNKDKALFDQALGQLVEARARRPGWSKIPLLAAEINDSRGQHDQQALENYLEAIELGERSSRGIARALNLLFDQKDYFRAESIIRKLQGEKAPFSTELTRFASAASVRTGDFDHALEMARKAAAASNDARDRIWLARVYQFSDKAQEAESEYRRARAAAPNDASAWVALIQFYATTGKKDLAQKTLDELKEAKTKIEPKQAQLALAYAYQAVGRLPEAEAAYNAAVKTAPDDVQIRSAAIEFKLRNGRVKEAESWLREFLTSSEASKSPQSFAWARRTLAMCLAADGTYPKHVEARGLIEKNLQDSTSPDGDLRVKALVDASFATSASHRRALETYAVLEMRPGVLTPDDRIVFARLLSRRAWVKSSQVFREVVTRSKDPRHIAAYVDALLNHTELAEADVWLRRLEELTPSSFVTADFRARLLFGQHHYGKAFDCIVAALSKDSSVTAARTAQRRVAAARLEEFGNELTRLKPDELTRLKPDEEARRFFTQAEAYLSSPDGRPGKPSVNHLEFLVRRGRNAEALEEFDRLCERASTVGVDDACIACSNLRTEDRQSLDRLERSIARVAQQRPTTSVWLSLAAVQYRRAQYDDQEVSLRRALALDGTRIEALNNLAYLLAMRKKDLTEARSLVERAITQAGPRGAILDSRAVVELAGGESDAALADSDSAVSEDPSAMNLFHQARARMTSGKREDARDAFQKAIGLGLTVATLPPLEVAAFQELKAQLEPPRR
jgi:cellulose synthase operon protein C